MTYTFSIQLTGGVDVKFGLTAPGRPLLGAEVSGAMQKINTMVIVLNGVEAYDWYLAQDGGTLNKEARPLPTIKVNGVAGPLPTYIGRKQSRGYPEWPGIVVPRAPPTQ